MLICNRHVVTAVLLVQKYVLVESGEWQKLKDSTWSKTGWTWGKWGQYIQIVTIIVSLCFWHFVIWL